MLLKELMKLQEEKIKPAFIKDPDDYAKIDVMVNDKRVGKIVTVSSGGYEVRLANAVKGSVRTISDAKKWAIAVLNKDRSILPAGSRWPFKDENK